MVADKKILPVLRQEQMPRFFWCWAAVGSSSALYYDSKCGWTMCKIANATLDAQGKKHKDCCAGLALDMCDQIGYLEYKDTTDEGEDIHVGSFVTANIENGYQKGAITYDAVMKEILGGRLLAYRLNCGSMAHFVILCGFDNSEGKQLVYIVDSLNENATLTYDEFVKHYHTLFSVSHTFFTKPKTT